MFDIKKTHPGIAFMNILESLSGPDVLQLAEKNPTCYTNSKILESLQNIFSPKNYGYSNLNGDLDLREKISQSIDNDYTYKYNPVTEITITAGASQAIAIAIAALLKEGDEVIIFEPSVFTYGPLVMANGGRPKYVQLKQFDFHIDWDDVQRVITGRTKLIILNNPHAPTGTILSAYDLEKLSKIINGTNILILSDETFHKMVFDKFEHQSIARFPKLTERSILISSLSKTFLTDGFKMGYCAAPAKIMEDFRRIHQITTYSVNTPFQKLYADIVLNGAIYKDIIETLQAKRNIITNGLKNSKFKMRPAFGTYYQVLNYTDISDEKDIDFVQYLREKKNITAFPLSHFYHDISDQKCIRICFAQPDHVLQNAVEIFNSL